MRTYSLKLVSDDTLSRDLSTLVDQDRGTTAAMLAHLAEFDARRLFVPAGFASLYAYCVGELRMSEDVAWRRIRTARAARDHPAIFGAIADGRLHVTGVCLLAPHLTQANATELLMAAAHRTKANIEALLAEWFPRTELLPLVQEIRPGAMPSLARAAAESCPQDAMLADASSSFPPVPHERPSLDGQSSSPGEPVSHDSDSDAMTRMEPSDDAGEETARDVAHVPVRAGPAVTASSIVPSAASRYAVQLNVSQATYDKLKRAESLLSHVVPGGEIAEILDRALDSLITQLERRKYGATSNPRPRPETPSTNARYIPAHIRRAVWQRDDGRCTFVSDAGHRCEERKWLEFDHIDPVALGGKPSVEGIRLRCRVHNQFEAEKTFGAKFMSDRRDEARQTRTRGDP